jgi:hypothetical protein
MVYEKAARGVSGVAQRAAGVPLAAIAGLRRRFGLRDLDPEPRTTMTDDRMALIEALQRADDGNFLRSLAATVLQVLMEADVEGVIGAGRYERSGDRSTWRNGYRDRTLGCGGGDAGRALRMPKGLRRWGCRSAAFGDRRV